jgi:hypothetical protein
MTPPSLPAEPLASAATDLHTEIACLAYARAERRHFAPGHDLDDWLWAEAIVHRRRATHSTAPDAGTG